MMVVEPSKVVVPTVPLNGPRLFANIQPYYGILPQVVKKLPRV